MQCHTDLKTRQEVIQNDRIYDFLVGLYDNKVRGDILRMTPLPKIKEVFFHIRREAQRHDTMLKKVGIIEPPAAMVVKIPVKLPIYCAPFENKDDLNVLVGKQVNRVFSK